MIITFYPESTVNWWEIAYRCMQRISRTNTKRPALTRRGTNIVLSHRRRTKIHPLLSERQLILIYSACAFKFPFQNWQTVHVSVAYTYKCANKPNNNNLLHGCARALVSVCVCVCFVCENSRYLWAACVTYASRVNSQIPYKSIGIALFFVHNAHDTIYARRRRQR